VTSYAGKILRVDLGSKTYSSEPLNLEWARDYYGGKGLGYRYLASLIDGDTDPLSPQCPLVLMTGVSAGTVVPCSGKLAVITKSPATGTVLDCSIGGSFGSILKYAGYDGVIFTGRAQKPVYVYINDGKVEFRDAEGLWGKGASDTEMAIREELGARPPVLAIGPAGENLVPMACITSEFYRQAGRGGVGAVMGSKNLKAVAVNGTGKVNVPGISAFMADLKRLVKEDVLTDSNLWAQTDGTPALVEATNSAGILPTRNFQEGTFEAFENLTSSTLKGHRVGKKACHSCPLACGNYVKVNQARVEGPEYETLALVGSNCGISDLESVVAFNAACDDLGLDTISAGGAMAFAMELAERGVHDLGFRFGDTTKYLEAPGLIARGEGIGAELGKGVKHLAEKYGGAEYAMHVKGLEFPAYEPRGSWGMGLAYATSDRGACHMRAWPVGDEALGDVNPFTIEGKAQLVIDGQHKNSIKFSLVLCDFWGSSNFETMAAVASRCLGRAITAQEMEKAGERIWNLGRLLNVKAGFRREHDVLPARVHDDPMPSGSAQGQVIPRDEFERMLSEYYSLRGWDHQGVPTASKLEGLGIEKDVAK
jgi:aldehyde:ferredoxin oxidoreductase